MLGVPFDCRLCMCDAVEEVVCGASRRAKGLLRCRRYYGVPDMVLLYKAQVLSYMEYRTPAISHAADRHLDRLDAVQTRYLSELGVTSVAALVDFNLAPLCVRRDIALLGVIHRAACGIGPKELQQFFVLEGGPPSQRSLRSSARRHRRHLAEPRGDWQDRLDSFSRSAFGLSHVYNLLPPEYVETDCVSDFQKGLQALVAKAWQKGEASWQKLLSPRWPRHCHPLKKFR